MKIEYQCSTFYKVELENWLKNHDLKYEVIGGEFTNKCLYFSIWSSRKDCTLLLDELHRMAYIKPSACVHYSDKDLSSAKLLTIRPKAVTMCIENEAESFRYDCCWSYMADRFEIHKANHEEQTGIIMIKKEPSMTAKPVFWGPDDGRTIIFADRKVRNLVEMENVNGISFQNVLLKNNDLSKRIFQLKANQKICCEDIVWGKGVREIVCKMCGKKQFMLPSTYQLHIHDANIYHEIDFFTTESIFGEGIPQPIYIISQRFYQLLKQYKFTSRVDFTPVILE